MKFFAFLLFTIYFLFALSCRPAAAPISVSNEPISINNIPQTNLPLPPKANIGNLGWTLYDGQPETLDKYKGNVVIMDFWATYCPPCLEEIPHLVELQNKYADLRVIGMHVGGEDDKPKVPGFVEKLKINYRLANPEDELTNLLLGNNNSIPQTVVFDRSGTPIKRFIGFDQIIKAELDEAVEEAVRQ